MRPRQPPSQAPPARARPLRARPPPARRAGAVPPPRPALAHRTRACARPSTRRSEGAQGAGERAEAGARAARCAWRGRPALPPGTPCSSRPRPCTLSTAAAAARAPCRTRRCHTRGRPRASRRRRQTSCASQLCAARRTSPSDRRSGCLASFPPRRETRKRRLKVLKFNGRFTVAR